MRIKEAWSVVALVTTCLLGPTPAMAGKPSGGGSGIKVEELAKPVGSVEAYAADINDSGTIVVGSAYWDATWVYQNRFYGVRWTRSSPSDPWVAEDLRPLMPMGASGYPIDGRAYAVNDAGTILYLSYGSGHSYVSMGAGALIDLGDVGVNDLSNNDTLIGSRSGTPGVALFWATPTSPPVELPALASGYHAIAMRFQGADVIGRADDASGTWVVRWVNSAGTWSVHRVALMPAKANGPSGMNSAGRIGLGAYDPSAVQYGWDHRPAVWDPPYTQPPVNLPTLSGTAGSTGAVLEDGTVVGVVTANSKTVKNFLPVIWPTPTSLVRLPLLSGAKYGGTNHTNAYRQIAGAVSFVEGWNTIDHAVVWTLP
jgi:uncharacterized membrane protein